VKGAPTNYDKEKDQFKTDILKQDRNKNTVVSDKINKRLSELKNEYENETKKPRLINKSVFMKEEIQNKTK